MNVVMLSDKTKQMLSKYRHKNEDRIMECMKTKRKYVSWDHTVQFLLKQKGD